jgi:streptogramin lyase
MSAWRFTPALILAIGLSLAAVTGWAQSTALVSTFAGQAGVSGSANGTGTAATFKYPVGVALDGSGNVYIGDFQNNLVRKITAGGVVSTLAGSGSVGSANGTGTAASFNGPIGVAVDGSGNVYVGDSANNLIRKITPGGVVTTFAGSGSGGAANGTGTAASFSGPADLAIDGSGNIYETDQVGNLIRKITSAGVVSTLAGSGSAGSANGTGTAASFSQPYAVAVDASGNVYIGDIHNNQIRKISAGGVVTTLAGSGASGSADGTGTAASFNGPYGLAIDVAGNVYVGDYGNNLVRKITSWGVVNTLAGSGAQGSANGSATAASFNGPCGVAVNANGRLYVAEVFNNLIRLIIFGSSLFLVGPRGK